MGYIPDEANGKGSKKDCSLFRKFFRTQKEENE